MTDLKQYHENPDDPGYVHAPADDPTGNSNPANELVYRDEQGAIFHSGAFYAAVGGPDGKVRFIRGNPSSGADAFFVIAGDGRIEVAEL